MTRTPIFPNVGIEIGVAGVRSAGNHHVMSAEPTLERRLGVSSWAGRSTRSASSCPPRGFGSTWSLTPCAGGDT